MSDLLLQAIELPVYMYSSLSNPVFMGQTPVDENNKYWVVMKAGGMLYKLHLDL